MNVETLDHYERLEGCLVTVFGDLDILRESAYVTATVSSCILVVPQKGTGIAWWLEDLADVIE